MARINGEHVGSGNTGRERFTAGAINCLSTLQVIFRGKDVRAYGAPEVSLPTRIQTRRVAFCQVEFFEIRGACRACAGADTWQQSGSGLAQEGF